MLAIGLPLIAFTSELPAWLETGAERAFGFLVLLAVGVLFKLVRGDYRAGAHRHRDAPHRPLRERRMDRHGHHRLCRPRQALAIGMADGLAGTARWCCC
jgi:hypothetical protein